VSKAFEKTIKFNTKRKISVDNLIMALSTQKEDEDNAEEDGDGN